MKKTHLKKLQQLLTPMQLHKIKLPAIQCVHFSTDDRTQVVHATDLDNELIFRFPSPDPIGGLVEWETIKKETKNPSEETHLEKSSTPLMEFPFPLKREEGLTTEGIKAETLLLALESLVPYMDSNAARPMLCGVYFQLTEGGFRLAATDGCQLRTATIDTGAFRDSLCGSFIIDKKTAQLLMKALKKANGWVSVTYDPAESSRFLSFRFTDSDGWRICLSCKKVPGSYPKIDVAIDSAKGNKDCSAFVVSPVKKPLIDHLKYIRPKKSDPIQRCMFYICDGVMKIDPPGVNTDPKGKNIIGHFQPIYLENFFSLAVGETIEIHYREEFPLWAEFEKSGVEFLTVTMPTRKG